MKGKEGRLYGRGEVEDGREETASEKGEGRERGRREGKQNEIIGPSPIIILSFRY